MMSPRIFIRNDDVYTLDREFQFFFDLAIEYGIQVIHAVIPGKMDQGMVRFLNLAKEKTPHLLDIVQHGWMHSNYSVAGHSKYEFGPSRGYEQQRTDIRQGLKKMRSSFGDFFTPVFVPPYHGYDKHTLQILAEEGFLAFSAGVRRLEEKLLMEIPAQISFTRYDEGRKDIHDARDVVGMLAGNIRHQPLSGVVIHHADFLSQGSRRELKRFFDYMTLLQKRKKWQPMLFSEILSAGSETINGA
jgi:peptidoglycan/xylan/chitin deacetylase (PgdA/CDA1 family)